MTLAPRRTAAVLAAAVLAILLPLLAAAPAQATGYRYWSFWKWSDSAWAYQQQGPAVYVPQDGGVDGWRFAVSPDGGRNAARPGTGGDFATICAAVPATASSAEVLAAVVPPLRYDTNGILCAIAGYPRTGCGDTVSDPKPAAPASGSHPGSGPSVGLIAGAALVALLAAAAIRQARRR